MNIVICDDEKQFLHSIKVKINSWAEKTGNTSGLMLHCFTSSEDVLDSWQHGLQIDALFMDIQIRDFFDQPSCCAGSKQIMLTQDSTVRDTEILHQRLL